MTMAQRSKDDLGLRHKLSILFCLLDFLPDGYLEDAYGVNYEKILGYAKSSKGCVCKKTFDKPKFRKVTHCIFDLDGTLVDSEICYHQVIERILKKFGHEYTLELKKQCHGGTDFHASQTIVETLQLPIEPEVLERAIIDDSLKYLPEAPLKRGAERLLRHLHEHKIPIALATNSTIEAINAFVKKRPKFFSYFHHKVSVSDPEVLRGKPQPDLFLVAAQRFVDQPKPIECLVFEDSPTGVQAAREAGMQVVMIPDDRIERSSTRMASLVIRTFLDFKPELFGLPPFKKNTGAKL